MTHPKASKHQREIQYKRNINFKNASKNTHNKTYTIISWYRWVLTNPFWIVQAAFSKINFCEDKYSSFAIWIHGANKISHITALSIQWAIYTSFAICKINSTHFKALLHKSSAVAEMGDHGHNRQGQKEGGLLCLFRGGSWVPSNTMWPGPRSTSVPSGVFIRPAVWPQ